MKVQTQVFSLLLITGIIISLVGAAYMWGKPLIDKKTTITDYGIAKDFVLKLDRKIVDIANTGSGEATITLPKNLAGASIRVIPHDALSPENNTIIFEFILSQPMLDFIETSTPFIPLETTSLEEIGTFGESEPRVIILTGTPAGSEYKMYIKIHYRELDTTTAPRRGYKIAINRGQSNEISGGETITISFNKEEIPSSQTGLIPWRINLNFSVSISPK